MLELILLVLGFYFGVFLSEKNFVTFDKIFFPIKVCATHAKTLIKTLTSKLYSYARPKNN